MNPELGTKSAEESSSEIRENLKGSDMVFITCGLGGGTGTGASPAIAEIARDLGCLTVAVVTRPFAFEGAQRRTIADKGFEEISSKVDTIISIPNDRILQIIDKKTSLLDAFAVVDDVLSQGVQGISELITQPGLINVDFADVKSIMSDAGSALMGIGSAGGENRASEAAKAAIDSPLLDVSIEGAKGILFTIAGGPSLTMYEINEAAKVITESADPNARIIFGSVIDESLKDDIKVTVIATGFGNITNPRKSETKEVENSKAFGFKWPNQEENKTPADTEVEPTIKTKTIADQPRVSNISEKEKIELPDDDNDNDLEIPTFIRKKMM